MPTIYNKVELDGTTLLDLSQDTASSASHIRQGYTAHLNDGTQVTGSYSGGTPTIQSLTVNPSTTQQTFNASGVDGYKPVTVSAVSQTNLTADNIKNGTTVTISNGTSNIYSVTGTYSGGGTSTVTVGTKTTTLSSTASSIQFTGLSGNPTSFVVTSSADIATNTNGVTGVVFDGTDLHGQMITTQVEADTGFTKSYSSGTLTITATSASFQANEYKLVYTYDGSSSDIHTADVQVGSGATSITFSSLSGRPVYWSCIFKSDFSTSSGYQRVIEVVNDGTSIYGMAMDSLAKAQTSWAQTYSGGNLTISSSGTNNGGYFHQPGYYQLTYAVDDSAPQYQSKTVTPTTSQQTVLPDSGYDALEQVTVNAIPNTYVQPTTTVGSTTYRASTSNQTIQSGTYHSAAATIAAVTQTNLSADNIKSGTTVTISNGQSNLWSVTGTYTGGGGGDSKNVQINQSTSRTSSSSLSKANGDITVAKTGTYDVYWTATRSATSTNYTWGSQLYIGSSGYGSENTTWSNHVQNNHLSNVSLTANQKVSVYTRGRSGSYYVYAPMLVIIEA